MIEGVVIMDYIIKILRTLFFHIDNLQCIKVDNMTEKHIVYNIKNPTFYKSESPCLLRNALFCSIIFFSSIQYSGLPSNSSCITLLLVSL